MALVICGECGGSVSSLAPYCPRCGAPKAARNNISRGRPNFGKFAFYIGAFAFAYYYIFVRDPISSANISPEPKLSRREIVLRDVKVRSTEQVDKFGFMNVELNIGNPTEYRIKNIKIECTDMSNTYVDLKKNINTVYDDINGNQQLRVKRLEMGMAHPQRSYTMCKMINFDFYD